MRDQISEKPTAVVDELDLARAQEYSLLSALLRRSPDAQMLARLARLRGDGTPLGLAHTALGEAAAGTDVAKVAREHHALFTGLGRGELLPYASYYLTGFLHGRPLVDLRQMLRRIGVERLEEPSEPEDHVATLLEIMAGLCGGAILAPTGTDREVFDDHIAPWVARFFADLETAESARFYVSVGTLGRTFLGIETQCFLLPR